MQTIAQMCSRALQQQPPAYTIPHVSTDPRNTQLCGACLAQELAGNRQHAFGRLAGMKATSHWAHKVNLLTSHPHSIKQPTQGIPYMLAIAGKQTSHFGSASLSALANNRSAPWRLHQQTPYSTWHHLHLLLATLSRLVASCQHTMQDRAASCPPEKGDNRGH